MNGTVQARGVRRIFRRGWGRPAVVAVAEATFEIGAGEVVCLVGAAASGKTTLLRLVAGVLPLTAGVIRIAAVSAGSDVRRSVGFAPRDPAFPPGFTVREVLAYCARAHARGREGDTQVTDALEASGLSERATRRAATLPLADGRRLLLAQSLLGGRRIVVLDEPFAGLDAVTRRDLSDRLQRLVVTGGSVLLSSADPVGLERLADRVLVLRAGRLVVDAPAPALLGGRILEVVLDVPPREPPPGFRLTATGLEADLGCRSPESALAVCRAHRLHVRASRVRLKTLDEATRDADGVPR
ncbi:MAG: ATP-binding cassette domain-containing protein [Acidobacteriota bacterium]